MSGILGSIGPPGQVVPGLGNPADPARSPLRARRHNRAAPQLLPKWRNPNVPKLIREAVELLVAQYPQRGKNTDRLHRLLKRRRGPRKKPTFYAVTRKRSDRTEAQTRVLIFQLEHCDLADGLRVGQFDKKAQKIARGYTLEEMARATELARPSQRYADNPTRVRSDSTLDRVIADLEAGGLNYSHQALEREETAAGVEYSGKIAERKLTKAVFLDLGIPAERFEYFVREAKDRRHQKTKQIEREKPAAPVGALISEMIEPAIADLRQPLLDVDLPQYQRLQWEVHGEHRDWSADQVNAEAQRRLQRTKPPPDRR